MTFFVQQMAAEDRIYSVYAVLGKEVTVFI